MENKKRRWLIPILILLALLLGTYAGGVHYATQKFLPNTSILGIDVSGKTSAEVEELLETQDLVIDVEQKSPKGESITESINLAEVAGATITYDTSEILQSQDKYRWFKSFFEPRNVGDVKIEGNFDEEQLKQAISKLYSQDAKTAVEPKDARIEIDGKTVKIVPDEAGSIVDSKIAVERILSAAQAVVRGEGKQKVSLADACKEPAIKANDPNLLAEKKFLEDIFAKKITVYATSDSTLSIEGEEVFGLLDVEGTEKSVNGDKLYALVDKITDDYYVNKYEYIYFDDLMEKLEEALLSEDPEPVVEASWYINYPEPEPEPTTTASSSSSSSSSGSSSSSSSSSSSESSSGGVVSSYIDVSITEQMLYYYENGELILSSPIVTGTRGVDDTPTGYYTITSRVPNARLRGPTWDEVVNFWMGIDNYGSYGLHDAPWRDEYGGDIYINNGSHGCVNLPYWAASQLFSLVTIGVTQVYIHY